MRARDMLGNVQELAVMDAPPPILRLLNADVGTLTGEDWIMLAEYVEERADVHLRESVRLEAEAALMADDDEEEGDRR